MNTDRIDFISAYCDRWCERCAYTLRCSAFAAAAAIEMCGDTREGLELAVGIPHPADLDGAPVEPPWHADLENVEMTARERVEFERRENARDVRIGDTTIMTIAHACALLSHRWFTARYETVLTGADAVLREALEIAAHDAVFVAAKLNRALDGRDRHQHGEDHDDHPVQNDWNGSAKVALMSVERSEAAWRVIAQATMDDTPAILADQWCDLRREVKEAFPHAWSFVRPGFDEPGR